jgi:hypothetical protein
MKMTLTEAVEKLRELIPNEDAVLIDDGAQMWDPSALIDAVREYDNGEPHDLAVNDEGISRVVSGGILESDRMYQVRSRPRDAQPHSFCISGFQAIEKVVTPGSQTSSRVYVPRAWEGRRVMVVLLDPLDQ